MKKKIIAIILCVAIIVGVTPVVAAQGNVNDTTSVIYNNDDTVQVETEPYIIGEIIEKRTEDTKHFLMSDRSILAAMYDKPVHYNNDGAWVDIDNSFSTNSEDEFENKSNSFKTKFSKKSNGNKLVTVTKDNYSLSWMLDDANKVNAQISQADETEIEDISVLKNIQGTVTYPDIQNAVDLQYVISGDNIKENIVLQSANAPTEFSFTYKFNKLKYRTNESNQIEFYDESNPQSVIFIIDTPYMYDSEKAYSNNIEMQVLETDNGFILTLTPDQEWLLSEDRVYPIVIDPTTLSSQKAKDIWDIEIRNTQTSAFDYRAADFLVGSNTNGWVYRTLLKYPKLPAIGVGGIVVNAQISLTAYPGPHEYDAVAPALKARPTDDIQVNIHKIKSYWPEDGAVWNNYHNIYNETIEDYFIYNDTDARFYADITKLVNEWYANPDENYGIMLKANDETAANHVMQFASSDYAVDYNADWRPVLLVNYRTCIGLEDYWSYTTQSMGGYGTGYVNNYNGNLTYVHNDVSFNSLINGFTLSHVYNSANTTKETLDEDNNIVIAAADADRYGKGWGLNLVQTLEPIAIKGNTYVKYVYTDGDGTKHYFVQENDTAPVVDEDGLGYTYTPINEVVDSGTTTLKHKITTKDDTVLKFDEWSYLRRIIDANGNTINLNYSPGPTPKQNYLSSITTSSGGSFVLSYDSNYRLTSIKDNANRVTTYSYTNGNLTKITYPDGTDLDFTYYSGANGVVGSSSWLQGIVLPNGFKYCYENHKDGKISSAITKSSSNVLGDELYFTYSNQQTNVRKLQLRHITYQFDTFGRVTCAYDSQGNSYALSYEPNTATVEDGIFSNNKLNLSSNNIRYINNLIANSVFADGLASWSQYKEAPDDTQITVVSDQTYVSSKSVKITSTASSIQALIQNPSTTAGKTYTLSANIKTENVVSATHGVAVEIVKSTSNGTSSYFSDFVTGTTDTEINNGFVTVRATISLASNENIVRIGVGLYNASGTVYVDSVQLEEGDTANKINMLSNSSFEKNTGSTALPTGYTANFTAGTAGSSSYDEQQSGTYSLRIAGSATVKRYAYQTLNLSGKAGDVYSFGGWAKANAVANHSQGGIDDFKITAGVYYANEYKEYPLDLNEYSTDWQYVAGNFVAEHDYNKILIYCSYNYNANTAYFDDMFLYRDTAQSYKYDENGNVISTADYAAQQSAFSYGSDNTVSKVLNPDGTGYEYSYDKHLVQSAKSEQGVESKVARDSYGNATESYITNSLYTTALKPGKTYRIRNKASGLYITNDTQTARQYAYDLGSNKSWKLESAGEGYYRLIYVPDPTRCLTLSTTQTNYEYNIEIATLATKGTDAYERQLFKFKVNSDGSYEIMPKTTPNQTLRPLGASTASAAKITSSATNNFDYFRWYFEDTSVAFTQPLESGKTYRLRALHSGQVLEVQGSLVKQYSYNQTRQQRFVITQHDGYYTITLADAPNKYIALDTTQTVSGNPVIAVKSSFDNSCKFNITTTGTMGTAIISPLSLPNSSITVSGASLGLSTSVVAATDTAARSQRFVLEPASDIITSSATYQNSGNYPHTVTDSRGNTTTYTYDTARGLETGVTDAKGNLTEYEYNPNTNQLDMVVSGGNTVEYYYDEVGRLWGIDSPSATRYAIVYDEFGNTSEIYVEQQVLTENEYDNSRGLLMHSTYGNGQKVGYHYDTLDRITQKLYNDIVKVNFRYDEFGNLYEKQDLFTNTTYRYNYDLSGRITGIIGSNDTSVHYTYDDYNRIEKFIAKVYGNTNSTEYIYGNSDISGQKNGLIYGVKQNGTQRISYAYDNLSRLNSRTLNTTTPFVTQYTYHQGATAGSTTTLVKTVQNGNDVYEYSYDSLGNITQIKLNGQVVESYTYDALSQLTTVTRGNDTYTYTYGNGGNIQSVKKNGTTVKSYGYTDQNWYDLLTSFNGDTITYDEIGNPLQYRDGFEFKWSNGRQLKRVTEDTLTTTYTYNADGLRATKNQYGMFLTQYYWLDGMLLGEKTGDEYTIFLYDDTGTPYGIIYDGIYYYYIQNAQGDITGILDANGNIVAKYTYDAWGNILSITDSNNNRIVNGGHIAHINPLRYRGYYYDEETGFYYLQSRYYDPVTGRFINADGVMSGVNGSVNGYNLFAYCFNNPVNMTDDTGGWPRWITLATTIAATIINNVANATGNIPLAIATRKVAIGGTIAYVLQTRHYDVREARNDVATLPQSPQEAKDSGWRGPDTTPKGPAANCHQYTATNGPNVKYVSPDGHREVIYNSANEIVLDSRDVGTYNFCPSDELWYSKASIGHLVRDIIPWVIFGNSDDDPGPIANEIIRFFE